MKKISIIIVTLVTILLMACDTKNNKESEKNIMENQIKAYDKAQGVENTLLKVEDERKKEMQRQGI